MQKYLSNSFVSINILSHIIHVLLSSDSCAFFATIPVSVSKWQTALEREMSREIRFFFTYVNGICHLFVVLVIILSHVIHDLLLHDSCASFATIPVSVSELQTYVEREMTREMWIFFTITNSVCHLFVVLVNILSHFIQDLLFWYPCASFATIPVSVS